MANPVLQARAYMASASAVLAGARLLQRLGVIRPRHLAIALAWSDGLVRRGRAAWRRSRG